MIKSTIKRLLSTSGVYAKWYRNIPYGIDWMLDIDRIAGPTWTPRVIFDVGANIGQTTLELSKHWRGSDIHAFEPVASTFSMLRANVAVLPHAFCHHCGLGDAEKTLSVRTMPGSIVNSLKSDCMMSVPEARIEEIKVRTADAVAAELEIQHIDVLKTDTEGFDLEVLKGASGLLKAARISFVLSEVTFFRGDQQHTSFDSVYSYLMEQNFALAGFNETGELVASGVENGYCNALFMSKALLRR